MAGDEELREVGYNLFSSGCVLLSGCQAVYLRFRELPTEFLPCTVEH
jgi:hypothetical protein